MKPVNTGSRWLWNTLTAALLGIGIPQAALCQVYPQKPVTMVVPFPGGSITESYSRVIAARMEPSLGQRVIVDPRPGGGSVIGAQHVIGQPPDGYTIVLGSPALAVKSAIAKPPFDIRRDLSPIGQISANGILLAVSTRIPARTAVELVDYARANPGKLNMSTYGVGTLGHLMGEFLIQKYGLKVTTVPFNGSIQNSLALSQGNGDFTFDIMNSLRPHIQAGKVRVISTSTAEREATSPDVPSMAESGVPGFNIASWSGYLAPAGTPRDIILKLNAALGASIRDREVRDYFARIGFSLWPDVSTPELFGSTIEWQVSTFSQLIRNARLDLE